MEASKEKAILEAAIHEFAEKGFERTSTNQIAKSAGTSKGLIFHYYKSKEKLYEASVRFAIDFSIKELDFSKVKITNNVIEELKRFVEQEFLFCKHYPDIYRLVVIALTRPPGKLTDKMADLFRELESMASQVFKKVIDGIDLKDDVNIETLQDVLQSHYYYYSTRSMGYFKLHPDAGIEDMRPFVDQFLAMLSMSLRGLLKDKQE
ncbi:MULTISPECIES: TetR/AcrR family transcriptional regulator [unclassified Sporolactobacillus]|uniref:TetR/AcrR family transcriptional regulator n=1 Tax=unclassified Sporolactobacillus TaxID=2628533 RepID=UPI002367D423|nr:TetR/AcrR family transcriptional regulator [Sporolactobacillus sp. CQH2019]MDD9149706.1 TetR/AcrR family transcriptional regulator [Sporolactobacillus sp. CQH2019]